MQSPPAILFDLDGTLLDGDTDRFVKAYIGLLASHVAHLVPPKAFVPALLLATQRMIDNDDASRTNAACFAGAFFDAVGVSAEVLTPVFEEFYRVRYPELRQLTQRRPEARTVVQAAHDAGCCVVLATNPVFPETAIRQRMQWAGVDDLPFAMVTSYETMHATKPRSEYYREIAAAIGRSPADCLMIGDSYEMDIAPSLRAGMRAYWIDEQTPLLDPPPRLRRGSLSKLAAEFV